MRNNPFNTVIVTAVSLILGYLIGCAIPSEFKVSTNVFLNKIYVKFHPDTQKDMKTIIMEKAGKNLMKYENESIYNKSGIDYRY